MDNPFVIMIEKWFTSKPDVLVHIHMLSNMLDEV